MISQGLNTRGGQVSQCLNERAGLSAYVGEIAKRFRLALARIVSVTLGR